MVDVELKVSGKSIQQVKFVCTLGEISEEIVVQAAARSIVSTAVLGLSTVVKLNIEFCEQIDSITFKLPDNLSADKRHDADVVLDTMRCGLSDLEATFSDFFNMEVSQL